MASTKEYRDFILEHLTEINVTYKPMMGEYLFYYKDTLFGGVYDDRLLVKRTETNKKYNMEEVIPYENAKPLYYVIDVDNIDLLKEIVISTYEGLK